MTNEQALEEAQARVDSFKEQAKEWMTSPPLRSQAIATIAIETEIKRLYNYRYRFDTEEEYTSMGIVINDLSDLQSIKEQILNTL